MTMINTSTKGQLEKSHAYSKTGMRFHSVATE